LAGQSKSEAVHQQKAASPDQRVPERMRKPAESKFDALRREVAEGRETLRQMQRDSWDSDVAAKRRYISEEFPRADPATLGRPPLDDGDIMRRALAYADREIPLTDREMDRLAVAMVKHHNDWNEALLDLHYQNKFGLHPCPEDFDEAHSQIKSLPEQTSEYNMMRESVDTLSQSRSPDTESASPEVTPSKNLADGPERGR